MGPVMNSPGALSYRPLVSTRYFVWRQPWNFVRHDQKVCAAWDICGGGGLLGTGIDEANAGVPHGGAAIVDRPTEGLQWKSSTTVVEKVQAIAAKLKVDPPLEPKSEHIQGQHRQKQQQLRQQPEEPDKPEDADNDIVHCVPCVLSHWRRCARGES